MADLENISSKMHKKNNVQTDVSTKINTQHNNWTDDSKIFSNASKDPLNLTTKLNPSTEKIKSTT